MPLNEMKIACSKLVTSPEMSTYDLKLFFYQECSDNLFDQGDNDYIKYDNLIEDLIFSSNSRVVKISELYGVVSMSYRRLNTGDSVGAYDVTSR